MCVQHRKYRLWMMLVFCWATTSTSSLPNSVQEVGCIPDLDKDINDGFILSPMVGCFERCRVEFNSPYIGFSDWYCVCMTDISVSVRASNHSLCAPCQRDANITCGNDQLKAFFVYMFVEPTSAPPSVSQKLLIGVGAGVGSVVVLGALGGLWYCIHRRKKPRKVHTDFSNVDIEPAGYEHLEVDRGHVSPQVTYNELDLSTRSAPSDTEYEDIGHVGYEDLNGSSIGYHNPNELDHPMRGLGARSAPSDTEYEDIGHVGYEDLDRSSSGSHNELDHSTGRLSTQSAPSDTGYADIAHVDYEDLNRSSIGSHNYNELDHEYHEYEDVD